MLNLRLFAYLGVHRDSLATEFVEIFLSHDVAGDDHQRSEGPTLRLATHHNRARASSACAQHRTRTECCSVLSGLSCPERRCLESWHFGEGSRGNKMKKMFTVGGQGWTVSKRSGGVRWKCLVYILICSTLCCSAFGISMPCFLLRCGSHMAISHIDHA